MPTATTNTLSRESMVILATGLVIMRMRTTERDPIDRRERPYPASKKREERTVRTPTVRRGQGGNIGISQIQEIADGGMGRRRSRLIEIVICAPKC